MPDRLVAVGDDLKLPAAVVVPPARLEGSTTLGRSLLATADAAAARTVIDAAATGDAASAARAATGSMQQSARRTLLTPAPSRLRVTERSANYHYPRWVSNDRETLYGANGTKLIESSDEGETWTSIHNFADNVTSVRQMTNGELLVATRPLAAGAGQLWKLVGGVWTVVLSTSGPTSYFQPEWGMSVAGGNRILVSEYGTKAPTSPTPPRYAWLSEDYGATWRVAFDMGYADDAHVHGCAYDPWWDRIWVVTGDSVNRGIHYSDDLGQTWTVATRDYQPVGILPMKDCIIFTTDDATNGIRRIWRTDKATVPVVETALKVEDFPSLTILGGQSFQDGPEGPAYFPFSRDAGGGPTYLVATRDGVDFYEVWRSGRNYSQAKGLQVVLPVASGKLIGLCHEESGSAFQLSWDAPEWVRRGTRHGVLPFRTWAKAGSGQGVAETPGPTGSALPDLDVQITLAHPTWVSATGGETFVARHLGLDGSREWKFGLRTDGKIELLASTDRMIGTRASYTSTVAPSLVRPGVASRLRASFDTDNGAGGATVTFYEATVAGPWVQVGTPVTMSGARPLPTAGPDLPLSVGAGKGSESPLTQGSEVHYVAVSGKLDGTDPVAVLDFNDAQWVSGDMKPSAPTSPVPFYIDPVGNVWTLRSGGTQIVGLSQLNTETYAQRPVITGSRAEAGALRLLLDALHAQGIIVNETVE